MKKSLLIILAFVVTASGTHAQDSLLNKHSLNFPTNKYGISIGNSHTFNGIRLNFAEANVKTINGINITYSARFAKNTEAFVNGISVGILPTGGTFRFLNLSVLGVGAHHEISGLTFASVVVGSSGRLNGLSACAAVTIADTITGVVVSGLLLGSRKANGLIIGGLYVVSDADINGVSSSLGFIQCDNKFNGVALTPGYLKSDTLNGFAIASYNNVRQMKGMSVALLNRTINLHGIQLGLINYAENNPKWLRILPFINFHI